MNQSKRQIKIGSFSIGEGERLAILSGPCVIESEDHTLRCAERLKTIASKLHINLIFKASYDKANRSSITSYRGPGIEEGLRILQKVKEQLSLPVVTDIHLPEEVKPVAEVCDLLQIPAFLCRQTDLIVSAALTKKPLHIKKGQFVAPWDMKNVVEKAVSVGNDQIMLADRGFSFGYNNLVSDMRSIPIMQNLGVPVSFDASHSVQLPGGLGNMSGGERHFIPTLAKAAVAAGCDAIFIESHPKPDVAKSDKSSVYPLDDLSKLLEQLVRIYEAVRV